VHLPLLHTWPDRQFRYAAENMALDEALFDLARREGLAAIRFYHWDRRACTLGYFHRGPCPAGEVVRRYTGGGLVEHGEDLTFCLVLPPETAAARAPAQERYRWLHLALARVLAPAGMPVQLCPEESPASLGPCFAHPVPWDLLDPQTGQKIGGGAQRRSRGAVIHQGSLRLPPAQRDPEAAWIARFLAEIAAATSVLGAERRALLEAEIPRRVTARYGTAAWNRERGAGASEDLEEGRDPLTP